MDEISWSWSSEKHIEVQEEKEHFVVALFMTSSPYNVKYAFFRRSRAKKTMMLV